MNGAQSKMNSTPAASFWTVPSQSRTLRVIGHRGAPEYALENTAASFRHALASGADAVETDVRLTADGTIVCLHDEDLLRVAGFPDAIRDLDIQAARRLFPALLAFDDFLEITRDKPVIVDLKEATTAEVDIHVGRCQALGAVERILFSAHTPEMAEAVRRRSASATISTHFLEGAASLDVALSVGARWIRVVPADYDRSIIDRIRRAGLGSIAVASPRSILPTGMNIEALVEIARLGIDAVIADRPDLAGEPRLTSVSVPA
ncbi:glycerophosphodiester phosphodiesterase [Bradyrhizobium sp. B117]|uniref:glycerophosphodiester phosphodiesterase n=1 Tax=Bradyrhizobium sp. B117 TaxID=3140246 RepID=UPI003182BE6A